jgi:tRNA dimethylallyltransferase
VTAEASAAAHDGTTTVIADPIAIVGATATGKSALALAAARAHPDVEIVAADAMQVYRGMDIGTAKPTAAEQRAVAHHAIDLVDPSETFTVAQYRIAAERALADIAGRGHRALLVGGSGLYVRAVVDRLTPPGEWPDLRAELDAEPDTGALHRRLQQLDPTTARNTTPQNRRRIVRALEVSLGSGRPFSSFGPGLGAYPPTTVIQIGLRISRPVLAARIEERVHGMIATGLLDEVRALAARPQGLSRTARQALGYTELLDHLDGRVTFDEAVERIVVRTRQFAARQERWFRRDPRIRWISVDDDPALALTELERALRN